MKKKIAITIDEEILEKVETRDEANAREIYYIQLYKSNIFSEIISFQMLFLFAYIKGNPKL